MSWLSLVMPGSHLKEAGQRSAVGTGQKAKTHEGWLLMLKGKELHSCRSRQLKPLEFSEAMAQTVGCVPA